MLKVAEFGLGLFLSIQYSKLFEVVRTDSDLPKNSHLHHFLLSLSAFIQTMEKRFVSLETFTTPD